MHKLYLTLDLEIDPWTKKIPEKETEMLLELLRESQMKMTVFSLGIFVKSDPQLLDKIIAEGHELGLHGYNHNKIQTLEDLKNELEKSSEFIERYKPLGFRAPFVYLPNGAHKILNEYGFKYDSSNYGPTISGQDNFMEIPITAVGNKTATKPPCDFLGSFRQLKIPVGSGLFGNWLPSLQEKFLQRHWPAVLLLHPWQFTSHPWFAIMSLAPYSRSCWEFVKKLPQQFEICPLRELYESATKN